MDTTPPITVGKLKELLSHYSDTDVVTVNLAPSGHISGMGTVNVTSVYGGIDWDAGKLILGTERTVDIWYDKCQHCNIHDDGLVTSKMVCKDLTEWKFELQISVDGKVVVKIPYNKEDLYKNNNKEKHYD